MEAVGRRESARGRVCLAARALQVLLVVLLVLYALTSLTPLRSLSSATLDAVHTLSLTVGAAVLVGLRAVDDAANRWAWIAITAAQTCHAVATVYYFAVVATQQPVPYASLADVGWIAFYPAMYVAMILLLRRRLDRFHASMWLDGLLAGLAVAAVATIFVIPAVLDRTDAGFLAVATALSYPIGDLLMVAIALGAFALLGWRPGRMWWLLAAGLSAFVAADVGYVFAIASDNSAPAGPLELGLLVGVVLPALAAWVPTEHTRRVRLEGWPVLVMPTLFTLLSLGMLAYAGVRPVPSGAVALSAAAIVVALVRTGLTFREVRDLAAARAQARTDELTGLPNRRAFLEHTQRELDRRQPLGRLVILLIDLDRFKEINDSFGHQMGDSLLRLVGPRLAAVLRESDVITRLGGDEFGIVLRDADRAYAAEVAIRLRNELRRPFEIDGLSLRVDASIGIAVCPSDGTSHDVLLQRADIAMYTAKVARTGYEFYRQDGDSHARRRLETLEQLRTAIVEDQLVLHYQPKLNLSTGAVAGVEALVRWEHPERGLVSPDGFLPLAEQAGFMRLLTLAVLEKAVRQLGDWRASGIDISVAVNLSVSNLQDTGLPAQIQLLLETLDVPADALELEITENVLIADPDRALEVMNGLRALGLRLSVDDYGTGYSSLSYLRLLPVQELKLDRAFVTHMRSDPRLAAIVTSTIQLAHSLGMIMVAEGVEDEQTLRALGVAGCDLAQGYHIARPQAAHQLTPWLLEHRPGPIMAVPGQTEGSEPAHLPAAQLSAKPSGPGSGPTLTARGG